MQGKEPGLRAGYHKGVRQLPRQERDRTGSRGARSAGHIDAQFAVEHKEGLLVSQMPVHGTAVAPLTLVFQYRQASCCRVPAGADANQRPEEPHCLLHIWGQIAGALGPSGSR